MKFRPWVQILAVVAVTVFMIAGCAALDPGDSEGNEAFLPDGSELVQAQNTIAEAFPENSGLVTVQIIGRGPALEDEAREDFIALMNEIAADPEVSPHLADMGDASAQVSYAHLYMGLERMLGASDSTDPEALVQMGLESDNSEISELAQNLDALLARDETGLPKDEAGEVIGDEMGEVIGGIGIITLRTTEGREEGVTDAQLRAEEITEEAQVERLEVRSLSTAKQTKESNDAQASSIGLLLILAMLVILILLIVFYRSASDVILSLVGLFLTLIWAFGFQAWLGPGGLSWVGPTSSLVIMIPVILIGLCVDYALQITGRYREELREGSGKGDPRISIRKALGSAILPLALAGGTTAISLFTNLTSNIGANRDLGLIAGLGVLSGLVIMTTFLPSIRYLLDRRRQRAQKKLKVRPLADSIPGLNPIFAFTTRMTVDKPVRVLGPILLLTIVALWGAGNISTTFSSTEFSPNGAETTEDIEFLGEHVGGQTETATILIESELTDDRTIRNLIDLVTDLNDPARRPEGLNGPVTLSLGNLVNDLTDESSENYDPALAAAVSEVQSSFVIPPEEMEVILAEIERADPVGFRQVVDLNPDGEDRTILQVQALTGDMDLTRSLVQDIDGLWYGDEGEITTVAGEVLTVEVVDEMLDSQTQSVMITIAAAGLILLLFFGLTEFRPVVGILAVTPVALVLLWVLGTMTLFGISYNIVTALITALSIGIGVDYTIHFIHRFLEEMEEAGTTIKQAVLKTKRTTGGALVGSGMTTVLGFLVLIFSPISGIRQFGIVIGITIFYSLLATILVLPALLTLWASYHRWRAADANLTTAALKTKSGGTGDVGNTGSITDMGGIEDMDDIALTTGTTSPDPPPISKTHY